jgi:hypothetical protein
MINRLIELIIIIITYMTICIYGNFIPRQNLIKGGDIVDNNMESKIVMPFSSDMTSTINKFVTGYNHKNDYVNTFLRGYNKNYEPAVTINDIHEELPYDDNKSIVKLGSHNGQRKLLLTEIQFLTKSRNSNIKYCLYAGSAPGNKTFYLSKLFPEIIFILIDPNKFDLKLDTGISHRYVKHPQIAHLITEDTPDTDDLTCNVIHTTDYLDTIKSTGYKIFIIQDFMTDKIADEFKTLDMVFISDIRSNVYNKSFPMDFDIYWNNSMMFNWINIMRPNISMLKIRTPYLNDDKKIEIPSRIKEDFDSSKEFGIDMLKDYEEDKMTLPNGEFYIQAWAPQSSTEMRLVIRQHDINNPVELNMKQIESKLNYYNIMRRTLFYHKNPNVNRQLGFCNCGDCALENKIWTDYGFSPKEIIRAVEHLGILLKRPLRSFHKYMVFEKHDKQSLQYILQNWEPKKKKTDRYKNQKGNAGK